MYHDAVIGSHDAMPHDKNANQDRVTDQAMPMSWSFKPGKVSIRCHLPTLHACYGHMTYPNWQGVPRPKHGGRLSYMPHALITRVLMVRTLEPHAMTRQSCTKKNL